MPVPRSVLLALLLIPGCAQPPAGPAASTDGRFRGTLTLTRNLSGQCGDTTIQRTLEVQGGQASIVYNRTEGLRAVGRVQPDGGFVLIGQGRSRVEIAGRIEGDQVTGTFSSDTCTYTMALRREA